MRSTPVMWDGSCVGDERGRAVGVGGELDRVERFFWENSLVAAEREE